MNNEKYNQIIDEVWKCFSNVRKSMLMLKPPASENKLREYIEWYEQITTKEEFINKCKTDPEFSEKWELKIEERELSDCERLWICSQRHHIRFGTNDGPTWYNPDNPDRDKLKWMTEDQRQLCDSKNIPNKLITITYNNETIEVYE